MTDEPKDAGNDLPPDGGNGDEPTGTPEGSGPNAEVDVENLKQLNKSLQEKAARFNAIEAENKVLKAREDALIRAQSPAARGSDPRAERLATVQRFADGSIGEGPDPVAAELLALRGELAMTVQELANVRELDRVSDEDKRRKIAEHFNANRNRLGDVKAARAEIENDERAATIAEKDAELERLRKTIAASKRNVNDVATHAREVSAAEHKDTMTQAQWSDHAAELARRRDAGDAGSEEAGKELYRLQLARRNGKVKVEG